MFKYIIAIIFIAILVLFFQRTMINKKSAAENLKQGAAFLKANQNNDGVQTTSSGLQYLILQSGSGLIKPGPKDHVTVHYHGTLLDGTVFDSSVDRGTPIEFNLNQVIPGWTEGLQLMVVGDKATFFIPSQLGYGNRKMGAIAPGSTLIFEVELLGINE